MLYHYEKLDVILLGREHLGAVEDHSRRHWEVEDVGLEQNPQVQEEHTQVDRLGQPGPEVSPGCSQPAEIAQVVEHITLREQPLAATDSLQGIGCLASWVLTLPDETGLIQSPGVGCCFLEHLIEHEGSVVVE